MRRFSPVVLLLLVRRSVASSSRFQSAQKYLKRDLPLENCPVRCVSSAMTMPCRKCSSIAHGDEDEVVEAFNRVCSTSTDKNVLDDESCTAYLEKLCTSGDLPCAVRIMRHLHDKQICVSLGTFNMLLKQTGGANSFAVFTKVFRYLLLSEVAPDLTSYTYVARALHNLDDSELMSKFVREILEITHGRDPTVVNRIIFTTSKYGHIDKSLIIFEELKKDQRGLDVVTFNTILDMLGKAGRIDQMLHEMKLMGELGHSPDIVTYNTVINCLRRLGRLALCKSFAQEMLERGISPDLRTYTALIDCYGRAGHVTDALEMFDQMKKSHQPSIYVYRALISDLKKAGRLELAEKFSEEMNSCTSDLLGPEDFKQKVKGRRNRNSSSTLPGILYKVDIFQENVRKNRRMAKCLMTTKTCDDQRSRKPIDLNEISWPQAVADMHFDRWNITYLFHLLDNAWRKYFPDKGSCIYLFDCLIGISVER